MAIDRRLSAATALLITLHNYQYHFINFDNVSQSALIVSEDFFGRTSIIHVQRKVSILSKLSGLQIHANNKTFLNT